MSELHVAATGRVQGVGFRWFVRQRAAKLGLVGWVRNRADGSVEVHAAGSPDALASFERMLREGPPGAAVASLIPLAEPPVVPLGDSFTILR